MAVTLNHTIVYAQDREASAQFLSEVLGLAAPEPFGPFLLVRTANDVSLDYYADAGPITHQHYAFQVSEAEFDAIFGRLQQRGSTYWADPMCSREGQVNHYNGGRGIYFRDPSGHLMEILTRP